ncbi:hypothetical protein [Microbacterium sp. A84]|uniref:hypothetical protein n=1 Tax=Microbacterium sp. A84 TaxID=3450715 RepID=UPI003F430A44
MNRPAAIMTTALLLTLLAGCTGQPTPTPEPTVSTAPSPSPSATEDPLPGSAPVSAFDVDCDQVAAAMDKFVGFGADGVKERIALASAPGWYAGPAEFMTQRAGGTVCAFDAVPSADGAQDSWHVMIVPGAQAIVDAVVAAGYDEMPSECYDGACVLMAREGDALLVGEVSAPALTPDDTMGARVFAQSWVDKAAASQQEEGYEVAHSAIAGAECDQLLSVEQLGALWGVPAHLGGRFGGWGVPAEVYHVVNGGALCLYTDEGGYESEQYLLLTDLPGGVWAFDILEGRTAITVAGADAAYSGTDEAASPSPIVDILVGDDWIRLTGAVGGSAGDLTAVAEIVAANAAALQ